MSDITNELAKDYLKPGQPIKIEILDEKDQYYQLSSQIERVIDDSMIITPPKTSGNDFYLPVDAEVTVAFYVTEGILQGNSVILARQSGTSAKLKITVPYSLNLINRRRARRSPLSLKMIIEYLINKNDMNLKTLHMTTNDINEYGISYISDEPLGKYTYIKSRIFLNDGYAFPVETHCRFVHAQKRIIKGKVMYKNALEFTKISAGDFDRIKQKVKY